MKPIAEGFISNYRGQIRYLNYRWPLPFSMTLPWPRSRPQKQRKQQSAAIFYGRNFQKASARRAAEIIAHETWHVLQIQRLGGRRYLLLHLWARIRTGNIWGRGHWLEDEAEMAEEDAGWRKGRAVWKQLRGLR